MALNYQMRGYPELINRPVKIHMAGWESDTFRLQKAGWQVSVEEMVDDYTLRIALKHPGLKLYAITNRTDCRHLRMIVHDPAGGNPFDVFELHVEHLACEIRVINYATHDNFANFRPIDATPRFEMDTHTKERSLDDFKIFRALPKEKEIIIKPESVGELLAKIQSMQDPFQEELREKRRKEFRKMEREVEDYELGTNIVAQVATLV
jgi:hypothetical protein